MSDFLISQRIFVLTQQSMDGCGQSGSILVIVNFFFYHLDYGFSVISYFIVYVK